MPEASRHLLSRSALDTMDLGNSTTPSDDDIATFQIVTWTSVVLIFTTLGAALVMFTIDASTDSMIYNQQQNLHVRTIT